MQIHEGYDLYGFMPEKYATAEQRPQLAKARAAIEDLSVDGSLAQSEIGRSTRALLPSLRRCP